MSKPDELLQQILCSTPALAWLERLTTCFFDRDAKKIVLDGVRAALPALASGLDEAGQRRLGDGVVQELCRQASRAAKPPASPPEPALPCGPELEDEILQKYPYPIAAAYHALTEQDSAAAGFGCLLDTYEALVHYLATVAVSAYLRTGLTGTDCNRFLLEMLLKRTWSTGDLFALLRETVRHAGDCSGLLPYPLPTLLLTTSGKPTPSCKVLESFIELRNRKWGHGTGRTEESFRDLLPPNRQRLEAELARMSWLGVWQLLRPVTIEGGRITRADLLNGCLRKKARPFDLSLETQDLADQGGDVRADRDTLLLAASDGRYLPLFPLSLFQLRAGASGQGAYFLQRCAWQTEATPWRLARASFVAYEEDCPEHEEGPREFVAGSLERHVGRLRDALPRETLPIPQPEEPAGDPDHTLPEVLTEQQSHLRVFVGREEVLGSVADWIDRTPEGKYLLLLGPPGQGKSALMAELARRETERGGCLLHMVKSHRSALRFVPALISQAARLSGASFGAGAYAGDVDDLRNAWVKALEAVVQRQGRAVVVLDALDELEAVGGRVTFLPPALPQGVRVVLTCRPDIPLVQELRGRLRGQLEERELGPLSESDFRLFLERRLEASGLCALEGQGNLAEVFRRLGGNPLFLHCFADDMVRRLQEARESGEVPFDLETLPTTLEAVFRNIYDRVRGRRDGQAPAVEGRQRARLLQLLCVAREPLTVPQLADLLTVDGQPLLLDDVCDDVEALSQWLLEVGRGRYKPWHQGLADFVRGQVLGSAGVAELEALFCRWLKDKVGVAGLYGLRHRAAHMLAAGHPTAAADLLLDLVFLETKVEAGLVFELAADFAAVVAALPEDDRWHLLGLLEEALRRDVHFLVRHPTALFQCLWNTCWWYDCPEAARHFEIVGEQRQGPLPWEREGRKLSLLLEDWQQVKACARPGFAWLRSLRPPDVHLGSALKMVLRGHESGVRSVCFGFIGRRLASGSEDKTVRVWDSASGQELLCLRGHENSVRSVCFNGDGQRLASASWDKTVRVWDSATGQEILCLRGHEENVNSVCFSADGQCLASGSQDRTVRVWDTARGQELLCLGGHTDNVWSVSFSGDGQYIASGSWDQTVRIWNAATGQELLCLRGHEDKVRSVCFSADGRRLASGSRDKTVRVWDSVSGQELLCLRGHEDNVNSVCFSATGGRLASGSKDNTVRLWDSAKGQELRCLRGHEYNVTSVAFSPDGERLVSGSEDNTVRLWDAASNANLLSLQGHKGWVAKVTFSSDGQRLASRSYDYADRVWDVASGVCLGWRGDVVANTVGGSAFPLRAVRRGLETVIESSLTGEPLAWFPVALNHTTSHPSGRTWAGSAAHYVCLFTLEGNV